MSEKIVNGYRVKNTYKHSDPVERKKALDKIKRDIIRDLALKEITAERIRRAEYMRKVEQEVEDGIYGKSKDSSNNFDT